MKRTAVDTNVLVRLLIALDNEQSRIATRLVETETIFVLKTVLLETEWILRSLVKASRYEINERFRAMLTMPAIELEDPEHVSKALEMHSKGMDFADALHASSLDATVRFLTFDRDMVRIAKRHFPDAAIELAS